MIEVMLRGCIAFTRTEQLAITGPELLEFTMCGSSKPVEFCASCLYHCAHQHCGSQSLLTTSFLGTARSFFAAQCCSKECPLGHMIGQEKN